MILIRGMLHIGTNHASYNGFPPKKLRRNTDTPAAHGCSRTWRYWVDSGETPIES